MSDENVTAFEEPTVEQVERWLRKLSYEERLTGYKMTATAGNTKVDMYSLPEAVLFLFGTRWDSPMLQAGFKGGINWVDVTELVVWLRDAVGDTELARAVEERVPTGESYHAQSLVLHELFTERVNQYRGVREAVMAVAQATEAD
ncbi:MAG: hypothetical protein ACYC6J_05240 [Coriobacteriia bacterium]